MMSSNTNSLDSEIPIVDQLSLTPEDARLFAEALFGKLVVAINQRLTNGENYEQVLDYIFDSLGHIIPYDRMGIALVDELGETLRLSWLRSKTPVMHLLKNYSAPLKESSLSQVFSRGEPRIINNLLEYAQAHPESESTRLALKDGIKSSLTCPLRSGNKPIGIVFFSSFKINAYDHDHVDVFKNVADELAVVVEQGRLQHFFSDNKAMVQSFRSVVHDLRSPLSIVHGYLDLALGEEWYEALGSQAKAIFSHLRRNTQYMFQLLEDLSQMSSEELVKEIQSVPHFCQEMATQGEALARAKDIFFKSSFENLPSVARFNSDKISRVLDNLFSNAIKFSPRNTRIQFSAKSEEDKIVFSVADTGLGIPEDEQSKLFCEFGRTSTRPTEGESSTGLGLAIARKFVEQHQGKMSVWSRPGEGSTFSFWIPV